MKNLTIFFSASTGISSKTAIEVSTSMVTNYLFRKGIILRELKEYMMKFQYMGIPENGWVLFKINNE